MKTMKRMVAIFALLVTVLSGQALKVSGYGELDGTDPANAIYQATGTSWLNSADSNYRLHKVAGFWELQELDSAVWTQIVLSDAKASKPHLAPWPDLVKVTIADPGSIGTGGGGVVTPDDPGSIGTPGRVPTPDPYLRTYTQPLTDEQKAAVIANLGLEGVGETPRAPVTVLTDIYLPSWDGEPGATHTDWLYKESGFFGIARYMATYTPYENSVRELPHISYSHDGREWFVPDGATPRIIPRRQDEPGNSEYVTPGDSDLVELPDGSVICYHLWTTETGNSAGVAPKNTVFAVRTTDGKNWTRLGQCFSKSTGSTTSISSPATIILPNGTVRCYYVSKLDADTTFRIWYRDNTDPVADPTNFGTETMAVLPYSTFPFPHHLDCVQREDNDKIYLFPTLIESITPFPNRHYHGIFESTDGVNFTGDGLEKFPRFPDSLGRGYYRTGWLESKTVPDAWDALLCAVDSETGAWGAGGDGPAGRSHGRVHLVTGLKMDGLDTLTFIPSGQQRHPLSGTPRGHKITINDAGDLNNTKDSLSWDFKTEPVAGIPSGVSVRVQSYNDLRLVSSANKSSGILEISGIHGVTRCYGKFLNRFPSGGIESVDLSGDATNNAQSYGGSPMVIGLTAIPDNLTISEGDIISQDATGSSFTVHNVNGTTITVRNYVGTVQMTNQQPIKVNGQAATNGGVTVKSSITVNPPVDGINVYLIPYKETSDFSEISGGYFEILNANSSKFEGRITFSGFY